jgi:hypothetical protein
MQYLYLTINSEKEIYNQDEITSVEKPRVIVLDMNYDCAKSPIDRGDGAIIVSMWNQESSESLDKEN